MVSLTSLSFTKLFAILFNSSDFFPGGREGDQGADLGHGRPGEVPRHHLGVSLLPSFELVCLLVYSIVRVAVRILPLVRHLVSNF